MSIFEGAEWINLYQKSSESPSQKYRLEIEQKRLRFTNLMMTRALVYDQKEDKIINELDPEQNPRNFWFTWLQVPLFQPDSNSNLPPGLPSPGRIEYKEYLLTRGPKSGAILIAIEENKFYEIPTPFVWKDAKVSPSGNKLAITCHRSKNDSKPVRVFDFSYPARPPYRELSLSHFPELKGAKEYHSEIEWIDDNSIKVTLPVYCGDDPLALGYDYYSEDITLSLKNPTSGMLRSVQRY